MSEAFDKLLEQREARVRRRDRSLQWMFILLGIIAAAALAFVVFRPDPSTRPIDPNTATVEQLATLPEVGPEIARRIVDGRPYSSPEDLLKVKGIGPKTLEKMKPRLVFKSPPRHEAEN